MADIDFGELLEGATSALKELDEDPDVIAGKVELANQAVAYARSIAPEDSGDYKAGIGVYQNGTDVGVEFADPISNIIEYGSEDTPEFAVRQRTEDHFNGMA